MSDEPAAFPHAVRSLRALVAVVGTAALGGWLTGTAWLTRVAPTGPTMKANTAVAFLVFALCFAGVNRWRRLLGGAAIGLIGLASLIEYLADRSLGIDQLLFRDASGGPAPGRMAPATAVCFVLLSVAMVTIGRQNQAVRRIGTTSACFVIVIAGTGIISFGLRTPSLLQIGPWVTMAFPTAVTLVAAGCAVLVASPEVPLALRRTAAGLMLRRTLAAVLVVPFGIALLVLAGYEARWYGATFAMTLVTTATTTLLATVVWRTAAVAERVDTERRRAATEIERMAQEEVVAAALRASQEHFRSSVDNLPYSVSVFESVRDETGAVVDFRWTYANAASATVTGYERSDLEGRTLLDVLPHHGPSGMFETYVHVVETGEPYVEPTLWYDDVWGDGRQRRRAFDVRANKLEDGFVVVTSEVTAERETSAELALRSSEIERAHAETARLGELGDLLQVCMTTNEALTLAGQSAEQLFPDTRGALSLLEPSGDVVQPVASWGTGPRWSGFAPAACWALRLGRAHLSGTTGPRCEHLMADDDTSCLCIPMMAYGETLGVLHVAGPGLAADANALDPAQPTRRLAASAAERVAVAVANLRLREKLTSLSIRDPLTGLFNRRFMEETFERELTRAEREGSPVGVMQIDIDHFKAFNDTYGHDAGDAVLESVAKVFIDFFRRSDVVCRYGGEEFTVILPGASLDATQARAHELRALLREVEVNFNRAALPTPTLSCGVAAYPGSGTSTAGLIRAADEALYRAKQAGRDGVVTATAAVPALNASNGRSG